MSGKYDILNNAVESANYDPSNLDGTILEKWFTPGRVQQREFGQQVALQQMQNEWNSEGAKLKRMTDAGINPYLAAQGIAGAGGSSSPSVGGVPSTPDGISPTDIANVANSATGGIASVAKGLKDIATTAPEVANLTADTEKKLAELGLTNEQIYAWQVDNKYRDENAQVDLRIKALNEQNTSKQWEVMHAQYELMTTQLDTELAKQKQLMASAGALNDQAALFQAQDGYYKALDQKTQYESQWAQQRIEFWKAHGFDINSSSTDAILVQMIENGKSIKEIVSEMSNYYGARVDSEQKAVGRNARYNAFEKGMGEAASSWFSRPESLYGSLNRLVDGWLHKIEDGKMSRESAIDEMKKNSDFQRSYTAFKADMKKEVDEKRKAYKYAKRHYGHDAAVEAYYDYVNALERYDVFDEDAYSDMLLGH